MKVTTRLGTLLPIVAASMLLATPTSANAAPRASTAGNQLAVISGSHQIINVAYNQCVVPASRVENAALKLANCRASGRLAVWTFVPIGSTFFLVNAATGFCAEVNDGTSVPGERVDQYRCNGTAAELWYADPVRRPADGLFYPELKNAGSNLCLDTVGGAGSELMQYFCEGNDAQLWIVL